MGLLQDLYAAGARDLSWTSMEGGGLIPHDGVGALNLGSPITVANQHFSEVVNTDLDSDTHQSKDTVNWTQADSNAQPFDYIGPLVRCNSTNVDYYWAGYIQEDGSGNNIVFINKTTGAVSADGPSSVNPVTTFTEGSSHTIELLASGTTTTHLSLVIDGTERLTWDDSTSPFFGSSNRKVGHVGYVGSGTDFLWHYETFLGQDTSAAVATAQEDPRFVRERPGLYVPQTRMRLKKPASLVGQPSRWIPKVVGPE